MSKLKYNKASILVFSLLILFMALAIALGITGTTIISQKMSGATGSSTQSFQVADSGAEIVLKKIKDASSSDTVNDLGSCSENKITGNIGTGKEFTITFYKLDGTQATCSTPLSDVDKIRSVGVFSNTTRAVEMAVATGGCNHWENVKHDTTSESLAADIFSPTPVGMCRFKISGASWPSGSDNYWYGTLFKNNTGGWGCVVSYDRGNDDILYMNSQGNWSDGTTTGTGEDGFDYLYCD